MCKYINKYMCFFDVIPQKTCYQLTNDVRQTTSIDTYSRQVINRLRTNKDTSWWKITHA